MAIHTIDLSDNNPEFFALSTRRYSKKLVNVPDSFLSPELRTNLNFLRSCLSATFEPAPESNTLTVKAIDGVLSRIYGPRAYTKDGNLVIRWGAELFPLSIENDRLSAKGAADTKVSFQVKAVGDRNKDALLVVTGLNTKTKDGLILEVKIGLNQDATVDEFVSLFNLDPESALSQIAVLPEFSDGTILDLADLPMGSTHNVKGARRVGKTVVLDLDSGTYWASSDISDFLVQNLPKMAGFTLTIDGVNREGKYPKVSLTLTGPSGFTFNKTLFLGELEQQEYTVTGFRTYDTNGWGIRAVMFVEAGEYILPVQSSNQPEKAILSGQLSPNGKYTLDIISITPPRGNQKRPTVNAVLEDRSGKQSTDFSDTDF